MTDQPELPLPAPPATGETPLVPARMVNEWVYCPRLAYLMWVEGEWAETGDTADGRRTHARVDRPAGRLPAFDTTGTEVNDAAPAFMTRAVTLSSERLGTIAKMDVIEGEEGRVTPIDHKRGKRPHVDKGAYEPERVQVALQAMILEDAGYRVEEGALWYVESRERVRVVLDAELRNRTERAVSELRLAAAAGHRRSRTRPSVRAVRSPESACPTRSTSSARARPRACSTLRMTPPCRSTSRLPAPACESPAKR